MKCKKTLCALVAVSLTMGVAFSGCSLIATNGVEDMKQTVATVYIGNSSNLDEELKPYTSAISSTKITKRQLIAEFIQSGYSQVQSGSSYATVFDSIVTDLTNDAVETQYAILYTLKDKATNEANEYYAASALETYEGLTSETAKLEYLLGGEDSTDVTYAKYTLYYSINATLDTLEESIINNDEDESGTDTRTTPTNVDTEKEKWYPSDTDGKLNYNVYAGFTTSANNYSLENSGEYKKDKLDNTTTRTRKKAYLQFITTLTNNNLILSSDDVTDILSIQYIQDEYVGILQNLVVSNYYDTYKDNQELSLQEKDGTGDDAEYVYIKAQYESLLKSQSLSYSTMSDFENAYGNMADTTFILYSPDTTTLTDDNNGYGTYGYVYNILLPFDTYQSDLLSQYSSYLSSANDADKKKEQNKYYNSRKTLLSKIKTTDQRDAWFNGSTDYSFNAADEDVAWTAANIDGKTNYYNGGDTNRTYLFFANNLLKTDRYESLLRYLGKYSFNGKVVANDDGTYTLIKNELTIDDMITEFSNYVNYALGADYTQTSSSLVSWEYNTNYASVTDYYKTDSDDIDYSNFIYATGKIDFGTVSKEDAQSIETLRYKAMSAVSELEYAYTTDTSVLSQYIGYTVGADTTSYIKEFEYAAQSASKSGAGTISICAGDYGWHIIYVTDTFEAKGGEAYSPKWTTARIETEGTFENKFYEWIKDSILSNVSTTQQSAIIQRFASDSVSINRDAYKNLRELDS